MRRFILASLLVLPATAWADPTGPAWTRDAQGSTAIFRLAQAPFPHPSRSYTDDRVMFFVPTGFRPGPTVDLVIHYHGHRNEIVNSDKGHRYREQLFLSKKNAVLVQPQGPVHASDSAGGKHEETNGLKRFVDEVLTVLARERVVAPGTTLGKLALSGHSGAYRVMARGLDRGGVPVSEVYLHDGLYGEIATFEAWAKRPGTRFVSTTTRNGGTWANNAALRARLEAAGVAVGRDESDATLASKRTLILETDVGHDPVTYQRLRWAKLLEHGGLSDLGVARPVLRSVRGVAPGTVEVSWYPPRTSLVRGYRVYAGDVLVAQTTATSMRLPGDRSYRVAALDDRGQESERSNLYFGRADGPGRRVLVVDGFVRTSGAWKGYDHGFAARVGEAASTRPVDTCRASAVTDGSVSLAGYTTVLWLAGDQSREDAPFTRDEQRALKAYVGKGTLLVSGSEVGYALALGSAEDRAFLTQTLRANYAADSDPGRVLTGAGALAGVAAAFGTAPYAVRFPDVFTPATGASVVLKYPGGRAAGIAHEATGVLTVGVPLECCDAPLVRRALEWMDEVNRRAGR